MNIPVFRYQSIIIGSGCAGLNAADSLYNLGCKEIALITEGMNCGTSRNTGSDKQTYYKMAIESGETDSVDAMAHTLFAGQSVNGDTALAEAAGSLRGFLKLVNLGVPFPTNEYGEFVGYQTDHDTLKRATSAGPLTSKYMTEALEAAVRGKDIDIHDNTLIVKLLVDNQKICGAIGLNRRQLYEENRGFVVFLAPTVVLATGGPAGIYKNSVYPLSQHGMTSLAVDAGAVCANLQEWQYGMASVDFRWNLSGTYQQVIPRYISIDKDGVEREFLLDYFKDAKDSVNYVFQKGYQWPFDSSKIKGSSTIDLIVYHEQMELGREVYLDYTREPSVLEEGFSALSEEAYDYLNNSDALIKTPIQRLAKMNPKAIALYKSHGINLYKEHLRITVAAQHNNGGVAVDANWQTSIQGLYCVGEAAGTFGVYRPGGSALNSTQVGSYRAAEHIAYMADKSGKLDVIELMEELSAWVDKLREAPNKELQKEIRALSDCLSNRMSEAGAHMRSDAQLRLLMQELEDALGKTKDMQEHLSATELSAWFRLRDQIVTQRAVVKTILFAGERIGNRGGSIYCQETPDLSSQENIATIQLEEKENHSEDILCYDKKNGCYFTPIRPIPKTEHWFEKVWNEDNKRKGLEEK